VDLKAIKQMAMPSVGGSVTQFQKRNAGGSARNARGQAFMKYSILFTAPYPDCIKSGIENTPVSGQ
jgi:hypothetical protein